MKAIKTVQHLALAALAMAAATAMAVPSRARPLWLTSRKPW